MLSTISWTTYFSFTLLLLVVYYILVGWRIYSGEIKYLFAARNKPDTPSEISTAPAQDDEDLPISDYPLQPELFGDQPIHTVAQDESEDMVTQVKELTQNIRKVVADASEKNYIKEEFFLSLQLLLKQYSFLKGTPALAAINNLIASECEKHGYIHLSAEERVMLWNEA